MKQRIVEEIRSYIRDKLLQDFLDNKPLYYEKIDYTRMPKVYEKLKKHFKQTKIIHIVGTNGKGTTGRFLATALHSLGFKVGHYSSPHILDFNERIWLNGENVSNKLLDQAHKNLLSILKREDSDSLSYFEYTTLLAMLIYNDVEYVVLEAGLGGEFDATSVFENLLTLVTPIAKDHEAFLGNTIEQIATTKLNAVQKAVILSTQEEKVIQIADNILSKKSIISRTSHSFIDKEDEKKIIKISSNLALSSYLKNNLILAIATLKYFGLTYNENNFHNSRLFGRLSKVADNILIDVGHNVLAAQSLVKSLQNEKYILIYNSFKDKDYKNILQILQPIIEHVELIDIDDERVEKKQILEDTLCSLAIPFSTFTTIIEEKNYLVFGSFSVVENFLKGQK